MIDGQWEAQSNQTYDYGEPYQFPNASYDALGNIVSVSFPEQFPNTEAPLLTYEWNGGSIVRASVEDAHFIYTYDGDRLYEERPDEAEPYGWLRYDYDGGNLVRVMSIFEETAFDMITYEYDGGVLVAEGRGIPGRERNERWSYLRDSLGRITVAEYDPGDSTAFPPERHTYSYCN